MKSSFILTLVEEWLTYCSKTGTIRWKKRPAQRIKAGDVAGSTGHVSGYIYITVRGHYIGAHQVAFYVMTGACPKQVDHHDTIRSNNRWSNLRPADNSKNAHNKHTYKNNELGLKGVRRYPSGRFAARIKIKKKLVQLGTFDTALEAHAAYCRAADTHFGEFARYA